MNSPVNIEDFFTVIDIISALVTLFCLSSLLVYISELSIFHDVEHFLKINLGMEFSQLG